MADADGQGEGRAGGARSVDQAAVVLWRGTAAKLWTSPEFAPAAREEPVAAVMATST